MMKRNEYNYLSSSHMTTQPIYHSTGGYGCIREESLSPKLRSIVSDTRHLWNELFYLCGTTVENLSGCNAERFLLDSDQSTYSQAVTGRVSCFVRKEHQQISNTLSLLRIYFLRLELGNSVPVTPCWEQKSQQNKLTLLGTITPLVRGLMETEQDDKVRKLYERLWDWLQRAKTFVHRETQKYTQTKR